MSGWKEYNITEVCDTISDTYRDGADKVVLINTSDVLEGEVTNHELVSNKNLAGQFKKKFKKDDILYSEIRPANRRYAYVDFEPKDYIASTKLMVLRSKPCILPKYLYYLLTNNTTIRNLHAIAIGRSGTFPQITYSELANIKFQLPSIEEQEKILATLLDIENKINVNHRINDNLETQAQALFKHWFIDFAPFKDGKFVDSELGMIPEGWKVGTLSDLGEIVGGATPSKAEQSYYCSEGIHWLTPKDLSNNCFKFTSRGEIELTPEGYKSCSAKIMPRGSVLFSSRAPIGYLTIAKNDICTNQGFKSVVPTHAGTAYIYYLLKLNTKRIESMSSGTTFKEASGSLMKSLSVTVPPKEFIDQFERDVKDFFDEQEVIEQESFRLSSLCDTLLPKLMSGQIKV